jgi:hypothetical protein
MIAGASRSAGCGNFPSWSPNHDRLTLSFIEDFIEARLDLSLVDGLHRDT